MILTTAPKLNYWRGSAIIKGQPQELVRYTHMSINVFRLKAIPDFGANYFKEIENLASFARVGFVANLQKDLLKNLALFGYTQFENSNGDVSCGYSLRIIYQPSSQNSNVSTEIYLLARVASNTSQHVTTFKKKQAEYIQSSLRSQLYKFEAVPQHRLDWQPAWLNPNQPPYCYEIIKTEAVFQWLEADKKYFYSPGNLQVNKGNNMIAFFDQLQEYREATCIEITLVPTTVESYEKNTISRYIQALAVAARGVREENISPNTNAQKAKSVYDDIQKRYYSGIVFLYSFRVFSQDINTCQSVANQLAATCTGNTLIPRVVQVNDRKYAAQTALQVNVNHQACQEGIWEVTGNRLDGFQGGPETMRRLHRLIDLDEASAFFRLPIPINQPCAGVEYDRLTVSISSDEPTDKFPLKLDLEDIIRDYGNLITEDTYVVGIDQDGKPCISDFSKIPHRIVAGTTGTGKTNFLTSMIYQFLYASFKIKVNREIYIADFKAGFDYYRIERRNESVKLVTKAEELVTLLAQLWNEYERRLTTMIDEDVESLKELREKCNSQEHRIILVIDEAASILSAERKSREEISKYLQELAAKSRVTGIHIFYCSQRPTPDVIPRLISDNMDERVIFRVFPAASQLLLDDNAAAELPADPKGRSVYRGLESQLKIVATPYVPKQVWNNPFG
jgi:hypothetical protein